MSSDVVDRLYKDFRLLLDDLDSRSEISLRSVVDANFRKTILLAAASYFEKQITEDILEFFATTSGRNELIQQFVKNKAVSRQYHSYFQWEGGNANSFFGLFGASFKEFMKQKVHNDIDLENSIKAFIEIGRDRNRLVHQDFGSYTLEKTAEEIYLQYQIAQRFIDAIPQRIKEFCESET